MRLRINSVFFFSFFAICNSTSALANPSQTSPAPSNHESGMAAIPLKVISQDAFCGRIRQAVTSYAAQAGYNTVQQQRLAFAGTVGIVEEFKLGRAADYLSAAALASYSHVPSRAPADGYLPMAQFLANAFGLSGNISLALSSSELRLINLAQKNSSLIVIAQNAAAITPERSRAIADLARQAGISINVVWVGNTQQDDGQAIAEARSLAWIAAMTGGSFANLGGQENPCATPV